MIRFKLSKDGLWYTKSHKDEYVRHLFRIGSTVFFAPAVGHEVVIIYEIIIWKLLITWSMA